MSLEAELQKYYQSNKFKTKIDKLAKTDKNFAKESGSSGGTEKIAKQYGQEIKDLLKQEMLDRDITNHNNILFLDFIEFDVEFVSGQGWIINVNFNKEKVMSKSLYSNAMDVYLPTLVNNEWDKSSQHNGIYWGIDRNNTHTWNSDKFMDSKYKGFIQSAVQKFIQKHSDCTVKINKEYDNGAF